MIGARCVAKELRRRGGVAGAFGADVTNEDAVAGLVAAVTDALGLVGVLERHGRPAREDIAAAVSFLASDAAAFVTGQRLVVDGGRSLFA